jgi:hypothetical protein
MSLVEPVTALSDRLQPHFGSSAQDEAGCTIVRFPGTRIPILVEAIGAPDLIRVSAQVARVLDWSPGLSDCLLRRRAHPRPPGILTSRRDSDRRGTPSNSCDDGAIAEAVRAVADVAADTLRKTRSMGATDPIMICKSTAPSLDATERMAVPADIVRPAPVASPISDWRGLRSDLAARPLALRNDWQANPNRRRSS